MEVTPRRLEAAQLRFAVDDESGIGECRRSARALAERHGFDELGAGRVCIVATELATNIVRHAGRGELLMQVLEDGSNPEFELLAIDRGPGIHDVDACMLDGYSTAGTAGAGLGAVARLSSTFDIFSAVGQGTVVLSRNTARREPQRQARPGLEIGAVSVALAGEVECGDTWRAADCGDAIGLLVVDGLGHGPLAASAARRAAEAYGSMPLGTPLAAIESCHKALGGTRGAAAACAVLAVGTLRVSYAGVGNISGSIVTRGGSRGMVSHNGTLGVRLLRTQQFEYDWPLGSRVVLHSDGLSARWSIASYPGLHLRHSAIIAAVLYRDFARPRDDVTVIVACHGRS